jgi:hypothetical protein
MASCNQDICPPKDCVLTNAIKDYKKARSGINDTSLKPFLKIIDEKLHVYYNENREVVNAGFNVTERQKSKDLYSTCPVDLIVEPDGKMSRKAIGDEKLIGKRVLYNDLGEDQFIEKNVYFLILSHKMLARPEFIRITY